MKCVLIFMHVSMPRVTVMMAVGDHKRHSTFIFLISGMVVVLLWHILYPKALSKQVCILLPILVLLYCLVNHDYITL